MKVFKFGGASVDSVSRIRNLPAILRNFESEKLLIVISAMGKTTNALEKVAEAFYSGDQAKALVLFNQIKDNHLQIAESLGANGNSGFQQKMGDFFTEVEWLLHDKPVRSFNYYYDQIVCIGELLSTSIVSNYLQSAGITNQWVDVRTFCNRRPVPRGIFTGKKPPRWFPKILPLFNENDIILTQGFMVPRMPMKAYPRRKAATILLPFS